MKTLTRPEGTEPGDLAVSRRRLALAAFGGYALYAFSAEAQTVTTPATGLIAGEVEVDVGDRMAPAYLARPDAPGRFPVVLVISEVFGVHEYIRDVCRRLARLGYVAIAPKLFMYRRSPTAMACASPARSSGLRAANCAYRGASSWRAFSTSSL